MCRIRRVSRQIPMRNRSFRIHANLKRTLDSLKHRVRTLYGSMPVLGRARGTVEQRGVGAQGRTSHATATSPAGSTSPCRPAKAPSCHRVCSAISACPLGVLRVSRATLCECSRIRHRYLLTRAVTPRPNSARTLFERPDTREGIQ